MHRILCTIIVISIIVPIYNAETYLVSCLDSLLAQRTDEPLEFLLVDDNSTDNSPQIAKAYADRDRRFILLSQPHQGQSAARNLAISHAKGEYIAFLDADDALEPEWCQTHLDAIHGVDYVQSGYQRVQNGVPQTPQMPRHQYRFTSPCMRLYRRQAIENLRFAEGFIYEDVLYSTDFWLTHPRCRMIRYAGYLYTLNPLSTTAKRHPEDEKRLYNALREKAKHKTIPQKLIVWYTIKRLKLHFLRS